MTNTAIKWLWVIVAFFWMYWSFTMFAHASEAGQQVLFLPDGMEKALTNLYREYYIFVNGFIALGMLTGVLAFIVLFVQLGAVGANPYMRLFILQEMLIVGVTTALLGGFPLMLILYYSMFS